MTPLNTKYKYVSIVEVERMVDMNTFQPYFGFTLRHKDGDECVAISAEDFGDNFFRYELAKAHEAEASEFRTEK